MKTIIRNIDSISIFLLDDACSIELLEESMLVDESIVLDCNISNVSIIENITPPEEWETLKYSFDGNSWELTQEWIDANTEEVEPE